MKIVFIALFGFAVASAADLSVGNEGGKLIYEQNVTASPTFWKQTRNLTVNATDDEVISQVVVIDNRPEKNGEAKVVEGGEGENNVTIELKGPAVFRGFDFTVKVFAIPESDKAPNHPKNTGLDTQNTQVPQLPQVPITKDIQVNDHSNQKPKTDDIIIGAPVPTATSTTEENQTTKDDQVKTNIPTLVGEEQARKNRDTKDQTPTAPKHVASDVDATKNVKVNEQAEMDEGLKAALDSVFKNSSSQKPEESVKGQAHPVMPQHDDVKTDVIQSDDENRKVRQITKEPVLPAVLPKDTKGGDVQTTHKVELSSTTEKSVGQKVVPIVVPVTSESSSTSAEHLTTESSKLGENVQATKGFEQNLKGHHYGHHHAVPLPYTN